MTNVVQCSLMQNNESGSIKKKKERKHLPPAKSNTYAHKRTEQNETNKKERKN